MHEKDIKRIVREQLKKKHPNWTRLAKRQKKHFAREVADAVIAEYSIYNQELDVPIEGLIGIEDQQVDSKIIPLKDMADFVDTFNKRNGVIDFAKYRKPWPEIHNKELKFIDKLLDDRILNSLLSYEGYSPQMRNIFPCQLFRAELMKALKYPEISYRKYCEKEYMGQERKENRRFLGLPLNSKTIIDHTSLCHFRNSLSFTQQVNVLIYILHFFHRSGLLEDSLIHGVDSTEISCDSKMPLYVVKVGEKKVRIYNDIDCDCGVRRSKRDKSKFVIGYRLHTLTAVNPTTGHNFPLISLLGPANHHDSLFLRPLIELAQTMGIEMKLVTADEAYNDKDGSILADTGVHLITPVSKSTDLPKNVDPEKITVTCDDLCKIPMIRLGLTEGGHEYKCNASPGICGRSWQCQQFRIIPYDNGHFQRIPVDSNLAKQAIGIRKNIERAFNLLKKREGLENARVRSQQALTARCTFATIATLLIEMAATRKKKKTKRSLQLELFDMAA